MVEDLEKGTVLKNMNADEDKRELKCRKAGEVGSYQAQNYSVVKLSPVACSECYGARAVINNTEILLHEFLSVFQLQRHLPGNSDRTRGKSLELYHRMFRFVIRKTNFLERALIH